ncbi:MAG: hypothetical protein JWM78_1512 [Verrucomicrobiaceae bacterium]|nr:hypothetical protein [Verrucomicrobiaceae bacterium]
MRISFHQITAGFLISLFAVSGYAVELNSHAVEFKAPKDIPWVRNAEGTSERAVLFGDPDKPGPYVIRIKWLPNNFSRPHFHNSDRFFTVISGTWWVGTSDKFDPENTVPMRAGTYVIHKAGQVHFDGAKDEEVIIELTGIGPVTSTPAAKK